MDKEEVEIYSNGACFCSVCSSIENIEKLKNKVNEMNPTGITSRWKLAPEKFKTGEDNPHPCEKNPQTRKHYLFCC